MVGERSPKPSMGVRLPLPLLVWDFHWFESPFFYISGKWRTRWKGKGIMAAFVGEDAVKMMMRMTSIEELKVRQYLNAEFSYMKSQGFQISDPDSEDEQIPVSDTEAKMIDMDEELRYISRATGLTLHECEELCDAEDAYLSEIGDVEADEQA